MSQCPTYYGRKNKIGGAVEIMESFQKKTVKVGSKKTKASPELIERGIFVKENQTEYVESYLELTKQLQKTAQKDTQRPQKEDIMNKRIVFSGSGGQGIITAAIILAEAAALYENLNAVQTQSYGPEARGGATRADVIISKEPIHHPKVINPHILICLTQIA